MPVVATPGTPNPKPQRRSRGENKAADSDPRYYFNRFFKKYPDFDYDPSLPIMKEFYKMCDLFWPYLSEEEIPPEKKHARKDFRKALVLQFNAIYGCDETIWPTGRSYVLSSIWSIYQTNLRIVESYSGTGPAFPKRAFAQRVYEKDWPVLPFRKRICWRFTAVLASPNQNPWRWPGTPEPAQRLPNVV
ncbi:hypothetical protein RhiJN_27824 [Ceratobasidium sp. AG-Ba]|nr:hypothetical protein RhiJN_27824 [Ceratobasidium sp. AG-Ba]